MNTTRFQRAIRVLIPTLAVAALALTLPGGRPVEAAGPRNCVDVTGRAAALVGCYEDVWVDGIQLRMTFFAANTAFPGATPTNRQTDFYVLAPQTDTAQGSLLFAHDHVVANIPSDNGGDYRVHLHGFFVLCSAQGIATGACLPTPSPIDGFGTLPVAKTVNGQILTSVEPIEAAVDAGNITLIDTGAVLIGTLGPGQ
jgi:hypothetical protein